MFGRRIIRPKYSQTNGIFPANCASRSIRGTASTFIFRPKKQIFGRKVLHYFGRKILLVRPKDSRIRFRKHICHGIDTQLHDFTHLPSAISLHSPCPLTMDAGLNSRSYSCKVVTQLPLLSPNSFCMKRDLTARCGTI